MNPSVKVSVIIPTLNAAAFVREAINSVCRQNIKAIEILCIDAGSTDGTVDIIETLMGLDHRIKLLRSAKKSYGYQMNMGIDHARGEYIGIVEADDYVPEDMYRDLYVISKEKSLDIIKSDFYRFTGVGDDIVRIYFSLTDRSDLYRRVFEPAKEQGSFLTTNNTWCGIYRRDFLMQHNIRHNESPGASFQDNGFFFQTLMYAKRVYLLNKPYYMNRRDNPGSSVFDRKKTYCICDEYRFIYDRLHEESLFSKYQEVYAIRLFMEYLGNVSRISSGVKREFIRHFANDFHKLKKKGELDISTFDEYKAGILKEIMTDPDGYWDKHIRPFDEVYDEAESFDRIIIYGAASIGHQAMYTLLSRGKSSNIVCFAVTKPRPGIDNVHGYRIKAIDTLSAYKEQAALIIAAKIRFQSEMKETAERLGFKHILVVPCEE